MPEVQTSTDKPFSKRQEFELIMAQLDYERSGSSSVGASGDCTLVSMTIGGLTD